MLVFLCCLVVGSAAAGFAGGWWVGFHAPLDDRSHVDRLAERDRGRSHA
jgi:hypothetical protein